IESGGAIEMGSARADGLLRTALFHLDGDLGEDDLASAVFLRMMTSGPFPRLKVTTWPTERRAVEIADAETVLYVDGIEHDFRVLLLHGRPVHLKMGHGKVTVTIAHNLHDDVQRILRDLEQRMPRMAPTDADIVPVAFWSSSD